jgi:uncharacterized membrane-anchored protein YitT (DUF2179 family)
MAIAPASLSNRSIPNLIINFLWLVLGCFCSAWAIKAFLIPNHLYDGGFIGISMLCSTFLNGHDDYFPLYLICFNTPFILLAYKELGKSFVIQMLFCTFFFWFFCQYIDGMLESGTWQHFEGDPIEAPVAGGLILGIGIGIIIRKGSSLDGAEILSIIINHKQGYSVGQIYLFFNIFVFIAAGYLYQDWHVALRSLMMFAVASKVMDSVIVGLDETKSITIISHKPKEIADAVMKELGLALTFIYGRGGYSGEDREIIYIVTERLQLAELKVIIYREDPRAFIAVENIHEVDNGSLNQQFKLQKVPNTHDAYES